MNKPATPPSSSSTPHIRHSDEAVKAVASSASGAKAPKTLFLLLSLCMFGSVVHFIHGYRSQEFVVTQQYSSKMRSHKEASWTREQLKVMKKYHMFALERDEDWDTNNTIPIPQELQDILSHTPADVFPVCSNVTMNSKVTSKVTIIIPTHKDQFFNLWRTLLSIFERTPDAYLEEVILFDDATNDTMEGMEEVLQSLYHYFSSPKLKIIQCGTRQGLIRIKNAGGALSSGSVLFFLEGHVEVFPNYLPPLLNRLQENPKAILLPIHDTIKEDDLLIRPTSRDIPVGVFDCRLVFHWQQRGPQVSNPLLPVESPAMPGGLLAISKEWWNTLGGYDDGLKIWGGENAELSLKTWCCGGSIEFIPCSRVGHLFRKKFPYLVLRSVTDENTYRVAAVWTSKTFRNQCKSYFKESKVDILLEDPSIQKQAELRDSLSCRSMDWYLEKHYPEKYPYEKYIEKYQ